MSGCWKNHHYLIHPGENIAGNSAETTRHNTFESGASTSNMRQPVTEHQNNQAWTIVDAVNQNTSPTSSESTRASSNSPVGVCSIRESRPRACFKVVLIKISCEGGTKQITTCAFLDGGSDASFCLESLVQDIRPTSFMMTTANLEEERSGYEVQLNKNRLKEKQSFKSILC